MRRGEHALIIHPDHGINRDPLGECGDLCGRHLGPIEVDIDQATLHLGGEWRGVFGGHNHLDIERRGGIEERFGPIALGREEEHDACLRLRSQGGCHHHGHDTST